MPRKWTPTRLRLLRKIDEYLDGEWEPLVEAVSTATTWGAPCALDCSIERLASKDCERLDLLLSGKWRGQNGHGGRRREELENERKKILMKSGSTSDFDEARLRAIRFELERMR
jgi:hypothetical protein